MRTHHHPRRPAVRDAVSQYLTPALWKQAHRAANSARPPHSKTPSRWNVQVLIQTLLAMCWATGDSQEERFATARAGYVAGHQHQRRPGASLAAFLTALAKLPIQVFRLLTDRVRRRIAIRRVDALRVRGWLPVACDGTRVECPRSAELQTRLGEAGKAGSAPTVCLSTMVLLPLAVLWAWRVGKGTDGEAGHLRQMLRTLPARSLLIADAGYLGYGLFEQIVGYGASYLIRMSSRAYLYEIDRQPLNRFREGMVYYWPNDVRERGLPPLEVRLIRIRGHKGDVWLLTNVLDRRRLSVKLAGRLYRWRWQNEGLFRTYKRLLNKVKLRSRTVRLVHREAEGSLLVLQLLTAVSADWEVGPRELLLRLRGEWIGLLRRLGPRQFSAYQWHLSVVRTGARPGRVSSKTRQVWPRRCPHKPPKPPHLRVLTRKLKRQANKALEASKAEH